jgi:eukaryotic-like serine/threonine-protein kinase
VAVSDSLIDGLFDGRYRIVRKLGAGGMADVYLAEDQELGRRVAIKILDGRHANDGQFIERFRREAKNAAALNHPNIVSIYDRGEAEDTYYIAMEYLEGRSLKELIVGRGAAPVNVAIEYARQILSALRFAHRHGIVHRDIKPHNVLVDGEGRVKVTDFGIARAGTSQMTETGSIVGTAQYLSPEQARGGEVDQRSDLYSLGVVLYELLTGRTPFDGDTPVEIAMKHLSVVPKAPSELRPGITHELDLVVLRALAKDPEDRYQSADEMEADLERVSRGAPVSPATVDAATQVIRVPTRVAEPTDETIIAPTPRRGGGGFLPPLGEDEGEAGDEKPPQRPFWPWLVALLFVIAAAAGGFFVWHELSGSTVTYPVGLYQGVPVSRAVGQITDAHLFPSVKRVSSQTVKAGLVFKQAPAPGTSLAKGGTVTIWVSTGKPKVQIPDVRGKQWPDAKKALSDIGLKPEEHIVPGPTKNQVTATDPAPGSTISQGSTVRVNVMSGPAMGTVPNVQGETLAQATSDLAAQGFNLTVAGYTDSNLPQNAVVSQTPHPGTSEAKGSSVKVTLSNGPPQVDVPPVVGETSQQATSDLEKAGFKVTPQYETVTDPTQDNLVQSESPTGGSQAAKGSTVTITIGQYSQGATTGTTTTTG